MIAVLVPGQSHPAPDRWRLWPAVVLIVVPFLGLIGLQSYQLLSQSPRTELSQSLVAHSFELLLTAQSLRSALQDAERSQRGYLLTGQNAYLAPYDEAVHSVAPLLDRLAVLTADDPGQRRQIAELAAPIDAKLAELRRTLSTYRTAGPGAARAIVGTSSSLDPMRSIEARIDTMIEAESAQRSRRLTQLAAQDRAADHIALMSALLVLVLMLSGLLLTLMNFRKGLRLQGEIQQRVEEAAQANRQLAQRNAELARAGELAREAKEEARRAEQAKGRFLATASHDLRQPLQAVSLLNGTLRRMVDSPQIAQALRQQDEAIGSMSKLLNALLDISKLEAGVIEPEPRLVPVARVLTTLEREFHGLARGKGLELRVAACDAHVHTDPALLEQILRNLVSNAIKYTSSGTVRLSAVADLQWVEIDVLDTGVGIAADQLQLIGEEFYQIGVPSNSTREGYGLGLSIVRRLVKLLGLELKVSSEFGKGSTFSIRLPRSAQAPAPERPPQAAVDNHPQQALDARILLVEDDPDVRNATRMLLRAEGFEVTAAASLADAVRSVSEGRGTDLLVTDFHLAAGETGIQVILRLREQLGAGLKAILITGDTSSAVKELAHDPYLRIVSKPVQAEAFLELVRDLLAA